MGVSWYFSFVNFPGVVIMRTSQYEFMEIVSIRGLRWKMKYKLWLLKLEKMNTD